MTRYQRRVRKHPHKWDSLNKKHKNGFEIWVTQLKKDGLKAFVRHPHHYIVAFGLSSVMYCLGHYGIAEHTSAWMYAVLENISTVLED